MLSLLDGPKVISLSGFYCNKVQSGIQKWISPYLSSNAIHCFLIKFDLNCIDAEQWSSTRVPWQLWVPLKAYRCLILNMYILFIYTKESRQIVQFSKKGGFESKKVEEPCIRILTNQSCVMQISIIIPSVTFVHAIS